MSLVRPGSQQQLGYNVNGTNGMMPPSNYGVSPDPSSGYAPAHAQNLPNPRPQSQPDFFPGSAKFRIYTATYSNVSVFEMEVNGVAVMRRRHDGWLNATQILKVAGVDKGKRTKVLEEEILTGEHEKVQRGYGKYQGTWINYHRGREFCRQYGIEQLLLPLLNFDETDPDHQHLLRMTQEAQSKMAEELLFPIDSFTQLEPFIRTQDSVDSMHSCSSADSGYISHPSSSFALFRHHERTGNCTFNSVTSIPNTECTLDSGYISDPEFMPRSLSATPKTPALEVPQTQLAEPNHDIREEEIASGDPDPTAPCAAAVTSSDVAQALCSSTETLDSSKIVLNPATPPQRITAFPVLGFNSEQDGVLYLNRTPPVDGEHTQPPDKLSPTSSSDNKSGSMSSDLSSSGWTEDGQDTETLRLTFVSSNALVSAYLRLTMSCVSKDCKDGGTGDSFTSKEQGKQQQQSQASKNRKRKLSRTDSGSDEFDESDGPKRRKTGSAYPGQTNSDILPLACPFNKYDNMLFGPDSPDEAYHACATCSFVNIAHLKQHLQRNHYVPKYYCFRCCRRFSSQATVASHMRHQPPCETLEPPLYRERIGPDLTEDLGLDRKNPPGTDRVEYWHRLYNAFFPDAAQRWPVCPYYEGPAAQHINRFLHFSTPAIRDLLPIIQQRLGFEEVLSDNDCIRLMEEILQEATQRYLQQLPSLMTLQIGHGRPNSLNNCFSAALQPKTVNRNANNATLLSLITLPSSQGSLQDSQPSTIPASMTSVTTIRSPNIPRTPLSESSQTQTSQARPGQGTHLAMADLNEPVNDQILTLARRSLCDAVVAQDLPFKAIDDAQNFSPFDESVEYSSDFDWGAELDGMEGYDWSVLRPEESENLKGAESFGQVKSIFS